jgi:hypothetical protein
VVDHPSWVVAPMAAAAPVPRLPRGLAGSRFAGPGGPHPKPWKEGPDGRPLDRPCAWTRATGTLVVGAYRNAAETGDIP